MRRRGWSTPSGRAGGRTAATRGDSREGNRTALTRRHSRADFLLQTSLCGPEQVREVAPVGAQIGASGDTLELPVRAHERTEVGLVAHVPAALEDAQVPGSRIDSELLRDGEGAVAQVVRGSPELGHA